MARERPDCDGLRLQVYAGRDLLTGRNRWVSRPVPGKGRAALKRAKQVEAELLVGAAGPRGSRAHDGGGADRTVVGGAPERPADLANDRRRVPGRHRPLHLPSLAKVQVAASWSRHLGQLLRLAAPVGGRAGRLLPADQEVGAEEVEAGY